MLYDTDPTRSSGGFSLDEAAQLYRRVRPGSKPRCPTCRAVMRTVSFEGPDRRISLVRCGRCGRSVVFEQAAEELP